MAWSEVKGKRSQAKGWLILCLGSWLLGAGTAKGQTFAEWFEQGKTQIRYLEQQIAALRTSELYIRQNYGICQKGWWQTTGYSASELNLHAAHYNALLVVKPVVKGSSNVSAIRKEAQEIEMLLRATQHFFGLDAGEQQYMRDVEVSLIHDMSVDLAQLQAILTDGIYQMTDDQRLRLIGKLQATMSARYQFAQRFYHSIRLFLIQRNSQQRESQELIGLYGTRR